jgi:rod shape determining protein RodA
MQSLRLKNHDWVITIVTGILLFIGSVVIFSTTVKTDQTANTMPKQLIFVIVGMIVYFSLSLLDISWLKTRTILLALYTVLLVLLLYVKFFGQTIASTNRWIDIGFFSLQPSEYAKIVLILITAAIFTLNENVLDNKLVFFHSQEGDEKELKLNRSALFKYLLSTAAAIPFILLTLVQPSLGNAVILTAIWLLMLLILFPDQKRLFSMIVMFLISVALILNLFNPVLQNNEIAVAANINVSQLLFSGGLLIAMLIIVFFAKIKLYFMLLLPLLAILTLGAGYVSWNKLLTNYQKDRISTFLQGPESDPLGTGYQVRQSKIAIGAGRLWGRGFLQGTQSNLNVLTQAQTDFIFAALSEQFGFIGALAVLALYALLIFRILKVGMESHDGFGTMTCVGIGLLLLLHVFINIGMNLGKLPVTGIPLPLLSYGGSSVFLTLISLGIVQSIAGSKSAVDISDTLMLRSQDRSH